MKRLLNGLAAGALCLCAALPHSAAAVTAEEAAQLKSTLTPLGGEKAGNKAGTIPAWTGGATTLPANYQPGDRRFDPFAADKPILTITADNMAKYADQLSDGVKAMLQKYPSFKVTVYPTRRSAAAPQWVYDNTFKNATTAKLDNDGLTLNGAYGGVPFPIPKSGLEVYWNHLTRWRGEALETRYKVWSVTADGQPVLATASTGYEQYPYYRKEGSSAGSDKQFWSWIQATDAPAFRAGEKILLRESLDFTKDRLVWQYLAGQRRIRRAPNMAFDTPDFVASGTNFFDEPFGGMGSPERFDFKLVGKKEMYVPYNTNRLLMTPDEVAMGPHHLKPEYVRWELHRVWVVEATLKSGKRHAVAKRVFYHDEDTWATTLLDGWDAQGKLWRATFALPFVAPDLPASMTYCNDEFHNLQTGAWVYRCAMGDAEPQQKPVPFRPDSFFSPDSVAADSGR